MKLFASYRELAKQHSSFDILKRGFPVSSLSKGQHFRNRDRLLIGHHTPDRTP
jgi:hypothetical protein